MIRECYITGTIKTSIEDIPHRIVGTIMVDSVKRRFFLEFGHDVDGTEYTLWSNGKTILKWHTDIQLVRQFLKENPDIVEYREIDQWDFYKDDQWHDCTDYDYEDAQATKYNHLHAPLYRD